MSILKTILSMADYFKSPKKCPGCGKESPDYYLAQEDYQGVKGKKLYKCRSCGYAISD
jgi:DNA-directed RNA polymerase subunit M/transcription elongation factor TFIIS